MDTLENKNILEAMKNAQARPLYLSSFVSSLSLSFSLHLPFPQHHKPMFLKTFNFCVTGEKATLTHFVWRSSNGTTGLFFTSDLTNKQSTAPVLKVYRFVLSGMSKVQVALLLDRFDRILHAWIGRVPQQCRQFVSTGDRCHTVLEFCRLVKCALNMAQTSYQPCCKTVTSLSLPPQRFFSRWMHRVCFCAKEIRRGLCSAIPWA